MYQHILIPTDGSEKANEAVRAGIRFAQIHGARVTGLYVIVESQVAAGIGKALRNDADRSAAAEAFVAVIADEAKAAGVAAECFYVRGDSAADEIVRVAEDRGCDLIHMASHARRGVAALMLGSVTEDVLKRCRVPVLVIR